MNIADLESKYGFEMGPAFQSLHEWAEESGVIASSELPGGNVIDVTETVAAWPAATIGDVSAEALFLYEEISQLYGPARIRAEIEEGDEADGEMCTWHQRLLRHGVPIGQTYTGDLLILCVSGAQRGSVWFQNHESWHGFFEHIGSPEEDERAEFEEEIEDVLEDLELDSTEGLTTDQFFELASKDDLDCLAFLAADLHAFWRGLRAVRQGQ